MAFYERSMPLTENSKPARFQEITQEDRMVLKLHALWTWGDHTVEEMTTGKRQIITQIPFFIPTFLKPFRLNLNEYRLQLFLSSQHIFKNSTALCCPLYWYACRAITEWGLLFFFDKPTFRGYRINWRQYLHIYPGKSVSLKRQLQ